MILQLASGMARKEAGELHIIHVWHLFGERYVRSSGMTEGAVQEAKALEKIQHKQRLDTLLGRADVTEQLAQNAESLLPVLNAGCMANKSGTRSSSLVLELTVTTIKPANVRPNPN